MPGQTYESSRPYLRVVQGQLAQKVDKTTPGAKLREYELANGQKGEKWELQYMSWTGVIEDIRFKDTDYGLTCNVHLNDAIISLNTSSRYFQDFACKLLSGDLTKEFVFHPYDIEVEDGKKKQGISLQQGGMKLKNYFYDIEGKKYLHDFPQVDEAKKEKLKKNYWKTYFAEVEAFLVEQLEKLYEQKPVKTLEPLTPDEIASEELLNDLPF